MQSVHIKNEKNISLAKKGAGTPYRCVPSQKSTALNIVNQFYMNIIRALFKASCAAIPRKKYNFYKYWWDEELVLLKDKAIQSFRLISGRLLGNHMLVMFLMI